MLDFSTPGSGETPDVPLPQGPEEVVIHLRSRRLGYGWKPLHSMLGSDLAERKIEGRLRDIEAARENALSRSGGELTEAVYYEGRRVRSIWAGGRWWAPTALVPEFLWLLHVQSSLRAIVE